MATKKLDKDEYYQPTEADKELTSFVTDHCDRWRDYRNTNFLPSYLEYERIFRGEWASEDKTRESERSRIVTPATQQAVETVLFSIIMLTASSSFVFFSALFLYLYGTYALFSAIMVLL